MGGGGGGWIDRRIGVKLQQGEEGVGVQNQASMAWRNKRAEA